MSDLEFVKSLNSIIISNFVQIEELADILRVSIPTIIRWKNNQNLPSPILRQIIIDILMKKYYCSKH